MDDNSTNNNRPKGREKHVTGQGKKAYKRGEGQNTGPVGSQDGYAGRKEGAETPGEQRDYTSSGASRSLFGGRGRLILIIVIVVLLLGGGGSCLGSGGSLFGGLFGGGSNYTDNSGSYNNGGNSYNYNNGSNTANNGSSNSGAYNGGSTNNGSSNNGAYNGGSTNNGGSNSGAYNGGSSNSGSYGGLDLSSLLGGYGNTSNGWSYTSNVGRLDTSVAAGARAKRTNILGNGKDTVTIMVYMCGTDLESSYGMGTSDLQEMASATIADNVNVIVYTGGCRQWKNQTVSSQVNQVYKIVGNGQLALLVQNAGTDSMVNPNTLAGFIQFCAKNFPANRNELIFWDHGGGSVSGYGYDEKYASAGSMSLSGIDQALKAGGVTFDFIGFDACLMATMENALMLTDYGDYLIASEETEPGVGWYYTNWLTKLSQNTSMSTLEIGKNIVDDFVTVCDQKCRGQSTTLSVVDLAELEVTAPSAFKQFSTSTSQLIQGNQYKTVSSARSKAREFAASNKIDQVDLIHLARNLGTTESNKLADTLLSAVKYNRTSSSMTNAYGLSIYFPYQRTSKVSSAIAALSAIGIDNEYSRCIQQFASMELGGQTVSGGGDPLSALLGGMGSSSSSAASSDMISQMLSGLMGGSGFFGRSMEVQDIADYITDNRFDDNQLVWLDSADGKVITLSEDQWGLVNDLELNVFLDDGEGFIDLGIDNVFEFTDAGALKGEYDGTWLAIDDQPVAYYHMSTVYEGDDYTIMGRVPAMLTREGSEPERIELLLVFDNENPYGVIAGYRSVYDETVTETVAKGVTELTPGDRLDFLCDYYSYDGDFQNSYYFGDPYEYTGEYEISNVYLDENDLQATYCFTDIYCQQHWTAPIP